MNELELIYALGALTVILIIVLLISENINHKNLDKWLTEKEEPDSEEAKNATSEEKLEEGNQDDDTSFPEAELGSKK